MLSRLTRQTMDSHTIYRILENRSCVQCSMSDGTEAIPGSKIAEIENLHIIVRNT